MAACSTRIRSGAPRGISRTADAIGAMDTAVDVEEMMVVRLDVARVVHVPSAAMLWIDTSVSGLPPPDSV